MEKIKKIQEEIGKLSKDKENPFFKSSYFDLNQILDNLRPLLEKYELTLIQSLTNVSGRPALKTTISNIYEDTITLPDLQDPQKMGSAITYYRRYALASLFLLQAVDDDANSAKPTQKLGRKDYNNKNKKDFEDGVDPLDNL